MLTRFCLYGFLKNQRYFEPFLLLAFLEKDLSFFQIGVLIAIRELVINLLEIPSGALADVFGRRRVMVMSFCVYAASFLALGYSEGFWSISLAMAMFGVAESFRTGTHKALIFKWLELNGRLDQKTEVYGLTRSWSKYGSAMSALIAAALVFSSANYASVFFWSVAPCLLSIINLLGYPAHIDPPSGARSAGIFRHMAESLKEALRRAPLRRLLVESMAFNGMFRASKDYIQPVLLVAAGAWFGSQGPASSAWLVGGVYFVLFLLAGFSSRRAHRFAQRYGGDAQGARQLWRLLALVFLALFLASRFELAVVVVAGFVALHVLQNLWRPILTSCVYGEIEEARGATILSIESQAHRVGTVVLAPVFGWMVDSAAGAFWPVGLFGAGVALVVLLWRRVSSRAMEQGRT